MKSVFIAADVEPWLIQALRDDPRFTLVITLEEAEVLITRTINRVDRELLEGAPQLEVIAQGTSGIDNIDHDAVRERGITLLHLPGVNANAVAEMVIGHIIALTRTIPLYSKEVRGGRWYRNDCTTRHELRHYLLGIVGFGNVGSRVAQLAGALGMNTIAYDPYVAAAQCPSIGDLLQQADVVTLHVPLTDETRNMIDVDAMKRGAILINASRGEVLDVDSALRALASNHLSGLALDVFDPEPPRREWPDDPRLILTPHVAGCTFEAKDAAARRLYEKLVAFYATR